MIDIIDLDRFTRSMWSQMCGDRLHHNAGQGLKVNLVKLIFFSPCILRKPVFYDYDLYEITLVSIINLIINFTGVLGN